jgi:hypothetical protein
LNNTVQPTPYNQTQLDLANPAYLAVRDYCYWSATFPWWSVSSYLVLLS